MLPTARHLCDVSKVGWGLGSRKNKGPRHEQRRSFFFNRSSRPLYLGLIDYTVLALSLFKTAPGHQLLYKKPLKETFALFHWKVSSKGGSWHNAPSLNTPLTIATVVVSWSLLLIITAQIIIFIATHARTGATSQGASVYLKSQYHHQYFLSHII